MEVTVHRHPTCLFPGSVSDASEITFNSAGAPSRTQLVVRVKAEPHKSLELCDVTQIVAGDE